MSRRNLLAILAGAALALILFLQLACISTLPHRTVPSTAGSNVPPKVRHPIATSIEKLADRTERLLVSESSVEHHPTFTVATIEFDDKGFLQAPAQAEMAIREIREAPDGALIVVFVHGWKHDGRVCDGNMCCFREVLKFLGRAEQRMAQIHSRQPRKVIGIYMAWRGASTRVFGVKELTFWNRKHTAHVIGSTGDAARVLFRVRDVYEELNDYHHHSKGNRLVLIGHSFGAAFLFDAVRDTLEKNLKERSANGCTSLDPGVSGFGDLVVLVNPAFEATRYRSLLNRARSAGPYCPQQTPILLTVATTNDIATRYFFPVGQALAANFRATERTTIGNFEGFWSHKLTSTDRAAAPGSSEASATSDCGCEANLKDPQIPPPTDQQIDQLISVDLNEWRDFGSTQLSASKGGILPYFPLLVVSAAPNVINSHNGIFSDRFVDFLLYFVGLSDDKKIALERAQARARGEVPSPSSPQVQAKPPINSP